MVAVRCRRAVPSFTARSVFLFIALLVLTLAPAHAEDQVHVRRERVLSLLPPPEAPPVAPGPAIASRALDLTVGAGSVSFVARYQLVAAGAGSLDLPLAGPGVRLDRVAAGGRELPLAAGGDGVRVSVRVDGPTELVVEGTFLGEVARGLPVPLLPAPGVVTVRGPASLEGAVPVGGGTWWSSSEALRLGPPKPEASPPTLLALGEVGVGLTVGEGELRTRAKLRWRVARGSLERVSFTVPGAGADLEVAGPQVGAVSRSGDRVTVELARSEAALVSLDVSATLSLPETDESRVPLGIPRLDGAFRTATAVQIALDGQIEVVPEPVGLEGVPTSELPSWAAGLVEGAPTAAYVGGADAGGQLALFRFRPAESPPTLVDVAQYTLAATEEGRVLARGHLAVRNDRGASLRVVPPPGVELVGVRVAGETAELARDGDAVLVPLAKSVETVEGLLTFPVELVMLGELGSWERFERGVVPLPVLDVQVAVARVTLHLPPGYRSRLREGRGGIVPEFTEGQAITYGFAVGDVRAAKADALFRRAVSSWMVNDFDAAQDQLDDLRALGASNEDVARLQGNLDLVLEGEAGKGDVVLERRIKEQARARAEAEANAQQQMLEEAERQYSAGEYAAAEEEYRKALEIGDKLGKLANVEDKEVASRNVAVQQRLEQAKRRKAEKAAPVDAGIHDRVPVAGSDPSAVALAPSAQGGPGGNPNPGVVEEALTVTAASLLVAVPALGEAVRYQRLLVPAGAPVEVPVRARKSRRIR